MNRLKLALLAVALGLSVSVAQAQEKSITVGWAAWDPANALMELSKDFTKETGIAVRGEFIPWPTFQEKIFTELNAKGSTYDVLIGDSQWIGAGATYGHYIELTDFFKSSKIDLEKDFAPLPVFAYSTWPKGSKRYWALPAEGDGLAFTYRKDWFERADLKAEFKKQYQYDLAAPKTWEQLRDIGKFFQGRAIDGKKVYGMAINTKRAGDGITMGVTNTLYTWGTQYENPKKPYDVDGYFNSKAAAEALEFYKTLYDCCTPPGWGDAYMQENLDAYTSGQVAMAMNWYAFFPGISKHPAVGKVTGYFSMPSYNGKSSATLGGQGMSIVKYSKKQDLAKEYLKWFARPEVQKKWWALGGYSCHNVVLNDPNFEKSAPYARGFKETMLKVRDFWQEPVYAELLDSSQKNFHIYVVEGKGTAQSTLDNIVKEWKDVFKADGKYN
ncbi:MAG TPA: extracellular solute-binding protein [Burkholderiales bacterium]|nr:extracellular solute-binding protein [Burkholderiales bacterium]